MCPECGFEHKTLLACYSAAKQRWEKEHGFHFYRCHGEDMPLSTPYPCKQCGEKWYAAV